MLHLWRRHNPKKCKLKGRQERKCHCAIWISGVDDSGIRIKESTRYRDWSKAESLARHWDLKGHKPLEAAKQARTTIKEWQDAFLQDAANPASKNLNSETIRKYKLLFRQLTDFAADKGYRFVNQLDLDVLTKFRLSWKDSPLTASKKLQRLRSIFKFAMRRKWISENPALELDAPKLKPAPTLPFSNEEMEKILRAATDARVKAFILTMRYSGLRISDTTMLAVSSLSVNNRLRLYQQKTGEYVYTLIPEDVASALRAIPHKNPQYFFWSGHSKVPAAVSLWRKRLAAVFQQAKIPNAHTHRLRDSFAVWLLQSGVSLDSVSTLLGHQSTKITQKHYSPWVQSRQNALDAEILRAIQNRTEEQKRNN